jgi:hypothetical protein
MEKIKEESLNIGVNLVVALLQFLIFTVKPEIWFALQGIGTLIGVYIITTVMMEDHRPVWYPLWTYQFGLVWCISIISFIVVHMIVPVVSWVRFILSYFW